MKKKRLYFMLLLVSVFLVSTFCFSYAFFVNKSEQNGKLNIVVGTLDYKLESNNLTDNKITVLAGEIKKINIKMTSLNSIASKYELYYTCEDNTNLEVGYSIDSLNKTVGEIEANTNKTVTVIIKNNSDNSKTITFGVQGGLINNSLVLNSGLSLNNEIDLCNYEAGETFVFDYTGNSELFTTLCSGNYQVELWGASGGDYSEEALGGAGGYTKGIISLDEAENFYLYVGGHPSDYNGGYNGGADGGTVTDGTYTGGGGSTDIRLTSGEWNLFDGLKSRIMVAAAGGGSGHYINSNLIGGYAGGLEGYQGMVACYSSENIHSAATGGTQTSGGLGINESLTIGNGVFGYSTKQNATLYGTGGGSGYYGGGTGRSTKATVSSGAGGSSFISGHDGCDAIKEESTEDNIIHTGKSVHYSKYTFFDTVMIDGLGYNWTTEKGNIVVGMPSYDGTSTIVGNQGNGYAKITYLGESDNVDEILNYTLINNNVTIDANSMKKVTVNLSSLSEISSNYELYYETDNLDGLTVGYGDMNNETSGIINSKLPKEIDVFIRNTNDEAKTLTFNVKGSTYNEPTLENSQNSLDNLCLENISYNFNYIESIESFITPCNGSYQVQLWGASGETNVSVLENSNGLGAYTSGKITLTGSKQLYVNVGSQYGYNSYRKSETSGGGATDIRLVNGGFDINSLTSRIMVAAGGGGGMYISLASINEVGDAGGLIGYDADAIISAHDYTTGYSGKGATQTSGGTTGIYGKYEYNSTMDGSFGIGGYYNAIAAGGGGGWYGGGHGRHPGASWPGGGGGSSYISGHAGCLAVSSDTSTDLLDGCNENSNSLECSISYTGHYFTDTSMIDGRGYSWTTEKGDSVVGMPTHDGLGTMTGNSGNGYAKITYLGTN